jgi:hypothetical protein
LLRWSSFDRHWREHGVWCGGGNAVFRQLTQSPSVSVLLAVGIECARLCVCLPLRMITVCRAHQSCPTSMCVCLLVARSSALTAAASRARLFVVSVQFCVRARVLCVCCSLYAVAGCLPML